MIFADRVLVTLRMILNQITPLLQILRGENGRGTTLKSRGVLNMSKLEEQIFGNVQYIHLVMESEKEAR